MAHFSSGVDSLSRLTKSSLLQLSYAQIELQDPLKFYLAQQLRGAAESHG